MALQQQGVARRRRLLRHRDLAGRRARPEAAVVRRGPGLSDGGPDRKSAPVRHGPYRFLRHPNYLVVSLEIAVLPLMLGLVWQALIFSVLNGLLLRHRMRIEAAALAPRQAIEKGPSRCAVPPVRP
ncbi:MAG: hypothetical protein HY060_10275 [Proteobacteria bacterium]|nr:hypothetical protein [Pseudomonadota bacterium]